MRSVCYDIHLRASILNSYLNTSNTALLAGMSIVAAPPLTGTAVGLTSEAATSASICAVEGTAGEPIVAHATRGLACVLSIRYSVAVMPAGVDRDCDGDGLGMGCRG